MCKNEMILSSQNAREFFSSLSAILEECRLDISPEGWKVIAVDPANVAMCDLALPASAFASYDYNEPEIETGLDILPIVQIINEIFRGSETGKDKEITFSIDLAPEKYQSDEGNRRQLLVKHGPFTRTILQPVAASIRKKPSAWYVMEHRYTVEGINTRELQRIVDAVHELQDWVRIKIDKHNGSIRVLIEADEGIHTLTAGTFCSWDTIPPTGDDARINIESLPAVQSLYSMDYLCDLVKGISSQKVKLWIGNDQPLIITFPLCSHGTGKYMLAPRVEG